MKREEVLRMLSQNRGQLEQHHGLRFIALFGSVARDQASPESDIDLLGEFATRRYSEGKDLSAFRADGMAYDAVLRNLQILEVPRPSPPGGVWLWPVFRRA